MERTSVDEGTELHDTVTRAYELIYGDDTHVDTLEVYAIESEYVEAEVRLPHIGFNREQWENEWSVERKIEVILHEFAHIEETDDEPDHGPAFYERLAELADIAESKGAAWEDLFGSPIDFQSVHEHIVDSVNEYTVETDIEAVEDRQDHLRDTFSLSGESATD